jgi:hypothetical protein
MNKPWYLSKTKWGSLIGGGAIVIGAILSYSEGAIDGATVIELVGVGVGAILFGIGLRNAIEAPKK